MTSQAKTESLDPITVEVVRYKLDGIANEMQSTLLRSRRNQASARSGDTTSGQ